MASNVGVSSVPPSPADIASQVQSDINLVTDAMTQAVQATSSNMFGLGGNQDAANALTSLQPNITKWISDGQNAAQNNTNPPGLNGWVGWRNAGQAFISGINTISNIGSTALLANIEATAQDITSELGHAVTHTVKAAGNAVGTALGTAAGSSITSVVNSTEKKVLIVVAGVGTAWFILHALKVLR